MGINNHGGGYAQNRDGASARGNAAMIFREQQRFDSEGTNNSAGLDVCDVGRPEPGQQRVRRALIRQRAACEPQG